jgi:16S rRNA (uracil1498-N3)-methyltransferase
MSELTKTPRLYVSDALSEGVSLQLTENAHHYLKNVMRLPPGSDFRVFNGRDGEFRARLEKAGKKQCEVTIENKLHAQQNPARRVHLLFPPLKKERMDFLIEKAVELGATDFHPILTAHTDTRKINQERIAAQIVEASEQCERMDIPVFHPLKTIESVLQSWDKEISMFAAIERMENAAALQKQSGAFALLIGPPGGFSAGERNLLASHPRVQPVSFGRHILRTETAALAGLALLS